ncbi:hypothetical protein Hs30E_06820 [Lactococcus hodotermopsidis]|uniref:Nitrogenase/oxidoreductase component 1 domain-containing protein n=1 Tax=Pseudolactococcus hodotermopsidis TaxID=2709157 RepID=A0A6A0BCA4_9LACT|nr:hypothetical protein Hs30E_06820 [Lactococcus hodotermopsidis]
MSYLYLDEADIISGGYEEALLENIGELLRLLPVRPKGVLIVVSCIDDLMGTDVDSLLDELREQQPDIAFSMGHMNPIQSDSKLPPAVNIQKTIYSFLTSQDMTEKTILLSGINVKIDEKSELYEVLGNAGFQLKHISDCKTYQAYQELAKSQLNLLLSPLGKMAAIDMTQRLKMPYFQFNFSFSIKEILENYKRLFDTLGIAKVDFSKQEKSLSHKIKQAREIVGQREIVIDDTATFRPFGLARFLYENGFNVKAICLDQLRKIDQEDCDWISDNTEIQLYLHSQFDAPLKRTEQAEMLAIGFEAGYYFTSNHLVEQQLDEGMFGFQGIEILLDKMIQASLNTSSLEIEIHRAGLVV